WAPFKSRIDWAVARWAKLRGSTSTAFSDLLAIEGLPEALGLSYRTSLELNQIIDNSLPRPRPRFQHEEIVVAGEAFDVYFRDIIQCIRALYGDPEFADCLIFAPERHYTDNNKTTVFHRSMRQTNEISVLSLPLVMFGKSELANTLLYTSIMISQSLGFFMNL
ncbi:hypothetical protein B0H14DRAFT_2357953, partial [Mycena olivaceomarginata]